MSVGCQPLPFEGLENTPPRLLCTFHAMNFGRPDIHPEHHPPSCLCQRRAGEERPRTEGKSLGTACLYAFGGLGVCVTSWRWGIKGKLSNFSLRKAVVFKQQAAHRRSWQKLYSFRLWLGIIAAGKMMDDEVKFVLGSEGWTVTELFIWEWGLGSGKSWVPEGTGHWQIHPAHCISEALLFWILATHEWPSSLMLPACEGCRTMPGDLSTTNSYHSLSWQSQAQTIPACERARLKYLFLQIMAAQI